MKNNSQIKSTPTSDANVKRDINSILKHNNDFDMGNVLNKCYQAKIDFCFSRNMLTWYTGIYFRIGGNV